MRKLFILMVALMATICVSAQEQVAFRYGCIHYDQVMKNMPAYAQMEQDLTALKEKYDNEMKASEDEFNSKYENFLSEQRNYAPSILRKRQSELEDMMKRNEQFRLESKRLLQEARQDALNNLKQQLNAAISVISEEYKLAFVLNLDSDAVPYLNKSMAYDITDAVGAKLKIEN